MKFDDTENRETDKGHFDTFWRKSLYDIVIQYDNMNDHGNMNK